MKPATVPGFHVDIDQTLYVSDVVGWCDKRSSALRVGMFTAPPPKSKLLSKDPNWIDITPWLSDGDERDATANDKPIDAEWDWGKT